MMMFSEQFLEQDSDEIVYNGKKINAFFTFDKKGEHVLKFTFISSSSKYIQAIILHWDDFEGHLFVNGKEITRPTNRFPQTIFDEKYTPKVFEIKVVLYSGKFRICNGSDLLGNEIIWRSLYGGCAMIIEERYNNCYTFYCNDHENDDDFDDLIFEMKISEIKIDE